MNELLSQRLMASPPRLLHWNSCGWCSREKGGAICLASSEANNKCR